MSTKRIAALAPLLASFALTGCLIPGPHVPTSVQGNVPVRIANKSHDSICQLIIQPYEVQTYNGDNWLGTSFRQKPIAAGEERDYKLKPGDYRVGVESCNSVWVAGTAAAGGKEVKLSVQGPTYVAIAGEGQAPPTFTLASYPAVPVSVVQARMASQQAPAGGGAAEPAGGGEESASEQPASDESSSESSSSESSESAPEPAEEPKCLKTGTVTNNYHQCCSESFQTNGSDQDKDIYVCG